VAVTDIEKSLITADMQLKTGFPSSHQVKSYFAPKQRAVLSADAGFLVVTDTTRIIEVVMWLLYNITRSYCNIVSYAAKTAPNNLITANT